ncbi:hypothetical protein Q7C36_009847 [Tachysurus vachellii]|uniref:non-specific serine/threonine protein kinase n=1 Tax=Tachysurus vachellii TaxID=175792 RepID=A0AA88N625_TACVA|nr:hypothetical protein Q7C36_009847 [Tachysurus vachellii]
MTSRRPMANSYSGNGRYGSQNGDDVLSPRLDSRSYLSNVRPENRYSNYKPVRSTFCTVMSQLTEETQPCFETTIKSKAVSETCNVKFTCVVTGYPVPELTWYKDDMELDRYCGLPKYEIFCNGKIHTLHIYNCTVDDAAIYQVSARNSKGIVSCSGVLEVGTMSEYKIHQRFFAKLKQKAELKRRELEHSYCQEKDNIHQEHLSRSQNNVRWFDRLVYQSVQVGEDNEATGEEITEEQPETSNEELNKMSVKVNRYPMRSDRRQENDRQHMSSDQQLIYGSEKTDTGGTTTLTKEKESRNNITLSNGFDEAFTTQSNQVVVGGKDTQEGMSLAKILSLQIKLCEEHQKTTLQSQELTSNKGSTIQERDREKKVDQEWENNWKGEQEGSLEKDLDFKQLEPEHRPADVSEAKMTAYKEPEYQHKSALSSVFHSLKDIFFGKNKKSPENTDFSMKVNDLNIEKDILAVNTEAYCHLPQTLPQRYDTTSGVCGTMPDQLAPVSGDQQNPSLHIKNKMESLNLDNHIHGFTTNYIKDISQVSKIHHESVEKEKETGPEALQRNTLLTAHEASDDHTDPNNDVPNMDQEMQAVKQEDYAVFSLMSTASMPQPSRSNQVSRATLLVPKNCVQKDGISEDKKKAECHHITETNKMDVAIAESAYFRNKSEADTADEREKCSAISQDKSTLVLDTNHGESDMMESMITKNKSSILFLNSFMENVQEFTSNKVSHDNLKLESVSSIAQNDNNTEAIKVDSIERLKKKQDKSKGKMMSNENKQRVDSKGLISEQGTGISHFQKQTELEGLKIHLNLKVEKTKIDSKVLPEKHTVESREQFVVSPIVILPDTRETVIKNVAKMRAMPFTPEIKVTVPEKVRQEEPFSVPRIDVLLSEHERVSHPVVHDITFMHRDNEPFYEETMGTALVAPKKNTRDDRVELFAEPVDVMPPQHEKNADWFQSDQKTTGVKTEYVETQIGDCEKPSVSNELSRENDSNSIPIISIACADDIKPIQEQEKKYGKPVFQDTVNQDIAALNIQTHSSSFNPKTHVESSTENIKKKEIVLESLTIISEAVGDFESVSSYNKNQIVEKAALQKHATERRNLLETQLSSDVSSALPPIQNTTACTTDVCPEKEAKVEVDTDRCQRDKPAMEKLGLTTPVGPTLPPLSPASLRKLMAKNNPNLESQGSTVTLLVDGSEKKGGDSGGSTPTSTLSCESSPKMKRRDSLTLIPSATPEELASGARRKIYLAKTKSEDDGPDILNKRDSPYMSPSQARRAAFLQLQSGQQAQHMEKRSPMLGRRKTMVEVQKPKEEHSEETNLSNTQSKPTQKAMLDPYKAPQVIRKIRGEPFLDALHHLKLWCQFFNILSDSTIKWFKDDIEIAEIKRSAGDESQVALAIVQASNRDCGVYGCTIKNDYGTDTTDYVLSSDILAEFFIQDDSEVGEEIEMTPLLFNKGLVDPGYWGNKLFGRIMMEELHIGEGIAHKISRAKVIYGLDPIFDSGTTCIVKVRNQIVYGTKEENCLAEINLEITKQECKIHNTVREYCKIFAAETRVIDKFGFALEVIPLYLIYRPANNIPYATIEAELKGVYLTYCTVDKTGRLLTQCTSEVEQKCCTFQHWIYQWTNGNLLVTQLKGVDTKITNVKIVTRSKGYQSLTDNGSPKILEEFVIQHQCNYYCGLLGLRVLTTMDSLQQSKIKTSRSPMLARRVGLADSSSPQLQRKVSSNPQLAKSPKVAKKTDKDGENNPAPKHKTMEPNL